MALTQNRFRIRTDAGAVDATPTWAADENTNFTPALNTAFRVRFTVSNTASTAGGPYVLRLSKNGGAYAAITTSSTGGMQSADASSSADEAAIATANFRLTAGAGTATAGIYDETGSATKSLAASQYTEFEYGVKIVSANVTAADTLELRVYNSTTAFGTYTQTPMFTVPQTPQTGTVFTDYLRLGGNAGYNSGGHALRNCQITRDVPVGRLVVLFAVTDNTATTNADAGVVASVTDTVGNTYTKAKEWQLGSPGVQGGSVCSVWYSQLTTQLTAASFHEITANFNNSTNCDAVALTAHEFGIPAGRTVQVEGTNQATGTATASLASLDVTTPNIECLRIRAIGAESNAAPAFYAKRTSGWNTIANQGAVADSGTSSTSQTLVGEYRISTGTGQASAPSNLAASADHCSVYVAFSAPLPNHACLANDVASASSVSNPACTTATLASQATLDIDLTMVASASLLSTVRSTSAYAEDQRGNWTQFAVNVPRITDKGLLVERQTQNWVKNNSMQGAAIGGALPAYWSHDNTTVLDTIAVTGIGVTQGLDYIDIRFFASAAGSSPVVFYLDTNTTSSVAATWDWGHSVFLALAGGSLSNVSALNVSMAVYDSSAVFLGWLTPDAAAGSLGASLKRVIQLANITSGIYDAATQIRPALRMSFVNGAAVDLTLRIAMPQLEQLLNNRIRVTSPIRTTGAAIARGQEGVYVPSVTTWHGSGAGTVVSYVAYDVPPGTSNQVHWMSRVAAGGPANAGMQQNDYAVAGFFGRTSDIWLYGASGSSTQRTRVALAWGADDTAIGYVNGAPLTPVYAGPGSNIVPYAPDEFRLGDSFFWSYWDDAGLDGYLQSITYYPIKVPDDLLVRLTKVPLAQKGALSVSGLSKPRAFHHVEFRAHRGLHAIELGSRPTSHLIEVGSHVQDLIFLLDIYPAACFAYSFRRLRAGYIGPAARIGRASDNAELDIGFDAAGNFNTAAAAAHIGASTGYVVTWYDQSGNGWHVTNVPPYVPLYSAAGMLAKPAADFNAGGGEGLFNGTVPSSACPNPTTTVMAVMLDQVNGQQSTLFSWHADAGNRFLAHVPYSNAIYWDYGNAGDGWGRNSVAVPAGWHGAGHVLELGRDGAGVQYIMVDGALLLSTPGMTGMQAGGISNWAIGETATGSLNYNGLLSELVVWAADLGANRGAARLNVKSYWGTP